MADREIVLVLAMLAGACTGDTNPKNSDVLLDDATEQWFDFSNLNDLPPQDRGPKVCAYKIRTNGHLLNITKNRDGGLRRVIRPCIWTHEGLEGYIRPDGESCPESTDARFAGLFVSGPEETTIRDLPTACYDAGIIAEPDAQNGWLTRSDESYSTCFHTNNNSNSKRIEAPADWGMSDAAIDVSFWGSEYGLPVEQIVTSGEMIEVVINPQYPAWNMAWDDVIFSWLVDFGYEPERVKCVALVGED